MLKDKNRKITVIGYDAQSQRQLPLFSTDYKCAMCKNSPTCKSIAGCAFVTYVQQRVPNTSYTYRIGAPTLHIDLVTRDDFQKTMDIINRAKRLRTFSQLKEYLK